MINGPKPYHWMCVPAEGADARFLRHLGGTPRRCHEAPLVSAVESPSPHAHVPSTHARRGRTRGVVTLGMAAAPSPAPAGMVRIPAVSSRWAWPTRAGSCTAAPEAMEDARPLHRVSVRSVWMDRTPVTNAQFARFVKATGYVTVAERPLNPRDFPGVPAAQLRPGGVVFSQPEHPVSLNDPSGWWRVVPGAQFRPDPQPAPAARLWDTTTTPSCRLRSTMRRRTRGGRAAGSRPKPSGSMRRAAVSRGSSMCGAMS